MYRKRSDRQLSFGDFGQPAGMNLDPSNRWIRRAEEIPWKEIEDEYAALFPGRNGNVAKPVRLVLGALLIQAEYGWSDEETAAMIMENPYMQFFCGYRSFDDSVPPFNPRCMTTFRKRITSENMEQIRRLLGLAQRRRRIRQRRAFNG